MLTYQQWRKNVISAFYGKIKLSGWELHGGYISYANAHRKVSKQNGS